MMGDHFMGNLTNAFRNVSVSRKRALQLIGGAMAVAVPTRLPLSAEAAQRRKPPLVFVAGAVTGVITNGTFPDFDWMVRPAFFYPAEDYRVSESLQFVSLPAKLPADKARAGIVEFLKDRAVAILDENATPVPRDRIAVTLI